MNEINSKHFNIHSRRSYLHYCVIEHLRLFNPINITMVRRTLRDNTIDGVYFRKDSEILILFSSILRNSKEFKNPDSFIPKRWNNMSEDRQNIVFGAGDQRCPQINFTPFYYKTFIYTLLTKFSYKKIKNKYSNRLLPHGTKDITIV